MSVVLEFSIPIEGFTLGRVLAGPPTMHCELERIVPTGEAMMPFVWVTGDDHERFVESVRADDAVETATVLETVGESGLYRIEWVAEPADLLTGIVSANGTVLQAAGEEQWHFRLRFPGHDERSKFHNYVIDNDIPCRIGRTYPLTETGRSDHRFDLSTEQREALVLALRRGYFATPSEVTLDELAEGLDISRQALSNRIRRGNERVLREVFRSAVDGTE
jgi:predicted DNA binding protein